MVNHAFKSYRRYILRHPRRLLGVLRHGSAFLSAKEQCSRLKNVSFTEAFPGVGTDLSIEAIEKIVFYSHTWNVLPHELMMLRAVAKLTRPNLIVEIGTFDGRTARHLAEAAGPSARVFTLDLPANDPVVRDPIEHARLIGREFRDFPIASQITQLFGDSTAYDFSTFRNNVDLAFIDAAHDYDHVKSDTNAVLPCMKSGGLVIWHDFSPLWYGVVAGACEACGQREINVIKGTSLAFCRIA